MTKPRTISGLSHSRGTGLTWDQMKALDAERRRLDAEHLARRVAAVAPSTPVVPPTPEPSPTTSARPAPEPMPPPAPAAPPSEPARGPRVIEVGKAKQRRAERAAKQARLDRIEQALDAALGHLGGSQSFTLGGR